MSSLVCTQMGQIRPTIDTFSIFHPKTKVWKIKSSLLGLRQFLAAESLCLPVCDVANFEIKLSYQAVFLHEQNVRTKI